MARTATNPGTGETVQFNEQTGQWESMDQQVAPQPPQQQGQQPAVPLTPLGESLSSFVEPALTLGSGIVSEPLAGLAGIAQSLNPFAEQGAGAQAVEDVRQALTFQPRTESGQAGLQSVGEVLQPVGEALQALEKGAGGAGFEAFGPIGGAVGEVLPTAALELLGVGLAKGGLKPLTRTPQVDPALASALTKGEVLTSDVFPPKTFVGGVAQKATERVPFLGTGKTRALQQESRVAALDNIAREFDIDPNSAFDKEIITSANKFFKKSQARASELRTEAVLELNKGGDFVPQNAIREIDTQMAKVIALGEAGDPNLLKLLQSKKNEMSGNFERLKDIRTTIFDDISDMGQAKSPVRSGGDAALSRVAGALSEDLDAFASAGSKSAARKWRASNKIFKDNFAKAKETELRKAFTKGKVTPEVINTTIKGGKVSELRRLHSNIDKKGRASVQQQILKNALERANGNPTIFANELGRVNARNATKIFFKGEAKQELDGVMKFINMTRRAQEAGKGIASQQEIVLASLAGGAYLAPTPVIGVAAGVGLLGRAFESKAVRNNLIKLSKMSVSSKKAQDIANQVALAIAASTAETKALQEQQ